MKNLLFVFKQKGFYFVSVFIALVSACGFVNGKNLPESLGFAVLAFAGSFFLLALFLVFVIVGAYDR